MLELSEKNRNVSDQNGILIYLSVFSFFPNTPLMLIQTACSKVDSTGKSKARISYNVVLSFVVCSAFERFLWEANMLRAGAVVRLIVEISSNRNFHVSQTLLATRRFQ